MLCQEQKEPSYHDKQSVKNWTKWIHRSKFINKSIVPTSYHCQEQIAGLVMIHCWKAISIRIPMLFQGVVLIVWAFQLLCLVETLFLGRVLVEQVIAIIIFQGAHESWLSSMKCLLVNTGSLVVSWWWITYQMIRRTISGGYTMAIASWDDVRAHRRVSIDMNEPSIHHKFTAFINHHQLW